MRPANASHWFVLALLLLALTVEIATANPSDKQPHASLDVHGQKFAAELLDIAQKAAEQSRATLEKCDALAKENKIAKIDPMELGQAHVNANRLQRVAEQLILLGEPAGVDYRHRASLYNAAVTRVVLTLQAIPAAAPGLSRLSSRASEVSQLQAKQLPKIDKLIARQDWDTAEKELYEAFDAIDLFALYVPAENRSGLYGAWRSAEASINEAMVARRKTLAKQLLDERAAATAVDFAKWQATVDAAAKSVLQSGKYTIDGKELTGPELVAYFDASWQKLQVQTLKALALEWVRLTQSTAGATPSETWKGLRVDRTAAVGDSVVALIAADAQQVDAANAGALYTAYLPVIADLIDHTGGSLESKLNASLEPLLAKSSEMVANVKAYRATTDELLRWRERVAFEQAQQKLASFADARAETRKAFLRNLESAGFFDTDPPDVAPKLAEPAGRTLATGAPKLLGKEVRFDDIVSLGGASQAGIGRYNERVYARLTLPVAAMAAEVSALETALQASEKQPPLSLAATRALRGARRGDLVACGGTVSGIFVEGYITRFATLPDAAALLLPLGKLPADYTQQDQLDQLVLRLDLQPKWAQQKYFFVEVK